MEVRFEIKSREKRRDAMRDQKLTQPIKRRRSERPQQNDAGEIEQESGWVFQEC